MLGVHNIEQRITLMALTISVVTLFIAPLSIYANAFRNPPGSSSALALDGAKSVMVDDASAISVNPANMSKNPKNTAMLAFTFIDGNSKFTSPQGRTTETRDSFVTLPDVYLIAPLGDSKFVSGLGITTPYGQSVKWPKESGLPYFTEMRLVDVAPSLSYKISDTLSIGGSLDLYLSQLETKQMIPWSSVTGNPAAPSGTIRLKGDDTDIGATLAVAWDMTEQQHLAVVYHSAFDMNYDGDTDIDGIPQPLSPLISGHSDFGTTIKFPSLAALGYAIDITDTITIGTEIEWIKYSRFNNMPIDIGVNNASGLAPRQIQQNWDDIWTYGLSGKWRYSDSITLRGSYKYLESPIPDATASPTLPDGDKHVVGIGIGWVSGNQRVDAGYSYSFIDDRNVSENQNPAYIGKYDMDSQLFSVAYSYAL